MIVNGYHGSNSFALTPQNVQTSGNITFYTYQLKADAQAPYDIELGALEREVLTVSMQYGPNNPEQLFLVASSKIPADVQAEYAAASYFGPVPALNIYQDLKRFHSAAEQLNVTVGSEILKEEQPDNWIAQDNSDLNKPNPPVNPPAPPAGDKGAGVQDLAADIIYEDPINWTWITGAVAVCVIVIAVTAVILLREKKPKEEAS